MILAVLSLEVTSLSYRGYYRTYKYKNAFLLTQLSMEIVDENNNVYDNFCLLCPLFFYVLKLQHFENRFYFHLQVIIRTHFRNVWF
jgi:hypothetical protein